MRNLHFALIFILFSPRSFAGGVLPYARSASLGKAVLSDPFFQEHDASFLAHTFRNASNDVINDVAQTVAEGAVVLLKEHGDTPGLPSFVLRSIPSPYLFSMMQQFDLSTSGSSASVLQTLPTHIQRHAKEIEALLVSARRLSPIAKGRTFRTITHEGTAPNSVDQAILSMALGTRISTKPNTLFLPKSILDGLPEPLRALATNPSAPLPQFTEAQLLEMIDALDKIANRGRNALLKAIFIDSRPNAFAAIIKLDVPNVLAKIVESSATHAKKRGTFVAFLHLFRNLIGEVEEIGRKEDHRIPFEINPDIKLTRAQASYAIRAVEAISQTAAALGIPDSLQGPHFGIDLPGLDPTYNSMHTFRLLGSPIEVREALTALACFAAYLKEMEPTLPGV